MRIAVIDDEKYSRVALVRQIESFLPHAEIAETGSGAQAVELLEKHSFDVLFIDIHLGDMAGTFIASLARRLMPQAKIIFATAFSEYAVRAFELRADDYLLKPFNPDRIREALKRSTTLLDTDEITYIETDGIGRGCILHTISGKSYPDTTSLGEYESRLGEQDFYRIHKTCLVHLRYIVSIFPWTGNSFVLRVRGTDSVLPISRELRRRLNI